MRERIFLPPALQWGIRVAAVVLLGIAAYAAVTEPMSLWERALGLLLGLGVAGLLLIIHGVVEVTGDQLRLRLFPVWRRTLDLGEVTSLDRVEVNPLADMGVLGLGQVDGATVLALRKGPAVQVTLSEGERLVVGLQRPAKLLTAIRAVRPDL